MTGGGHDLPAELDAILREMAPAGGGFRHRQHIELAFIAVRRYGTAAAADRISGWLRHLAAYQRAPQKYHETVTRAWTALVGHHVAEDPAVASFARFADRYAQLLDKRLLARHYSPATLASSRARTSFVAPDLLPLPCEQARCRHD